MLLTLFVFVVSVVEMLYNGVYAAHLFQLCAHWRHVGNLKSALVQVLTPWKLANEANQDWTYCFLIV